jgi:hypothetical protein
MYLKPSGEGDLYPVAQVTFDFLNIAGQPATEQPSLRTDAIGVSSGFESSDICEESHGSSGL